MHLELIDKFKTLPDELIHNIVNYTDVIVYRHGKYINRLHYNDERYKILMSIPKPIKQTHNNYLLKLGTRNNRNNIKYYLLYSINLDIILDVHVFEQDIDGFDKYTITKSCTRYIFDSNSKWHKIINYTM